MGVYYIGTQTDGTYTAAYANSIYIVGELLVGDDSGFSFGRVNDNVLVANGDIYGSFYGVIGNGPSHLTVQVGQDSTIRGYYGAITLYGNAHTVINAGTVATDAYVGVGVHFYNYAASPGEGTLRNSGEIFSYDRGVLVEGVRLLLDNSGSIVGAHGAGIATATGGSRIINSGDITGDTVALAMAGGVGETDWVTNRGTITGASGVAITNDVAVLRLDNTGTIFGDIDAGAGADRIVNAGYISGDVALGADDDSYIARRAGEAGLVTGDAGTDTLTGRRGDDWFEGGDGSDSLTGSAGDDSLLGGADSDVLFGGGGDDTVAGGLGDDTMSGGRGSDVFVYAAGEAYDVVTDLNWRADLLDMTGTGLDRPTILAAASQVDTDVVIDLGDWNILILERFSLRYLDSVLVAPDVIPV